MKKITILILIFLTTCKKQSTPPSCYECDMTYANGQPAARQYPCTTNIHEWQKEQQDNNGNPISSVCKRR